jgi:hypothetical protein
LYRYNQDHDGSHIKGLLINFLHHHFPSLLKIPGFLGRGSDSSGATKADININSLSSAFFFLLAVKNNPALYSLR